MTIEEQLAAGLCHHQAGRPSEAETAYRQILTAQADHPDALNLLGIVRSQRGDHRAGLELLDRAVAARPTSAAYLCNRALILRRLHRPEAAIADLQQAVLLRPDDVQTLCGLGNAMIEARRAADAVDAYQRASTLDPRSPEILRRLGAALRQCGRTAEAATAYQQSLALRPDSAEILNDLARLLLDLGRYEETVELNQRVVALAPDSAEAFCNLGVTLGALRRTDEAIATLRKAIEMRPDFAEAHSNLAKMLVAGGWIGQAIAAYDRAMAFDPGHATAHSARIGMMYYHPDYDYASIRQEQRRWNEHHAAPLAESISPHANDRSPDRKLRIGYVSPDFRDHVVGWNVLRLVKEHHRDQFEVFCYSNHVIFDAVTAQFRESADAWRSVAGLNDDQVARMIRDDRIDVLVDLALHSNSNRLLTFARKPAPVQVSYLGSLGATGLKTIDYHFSDPHIDRTEKDLHRHGDTTIRLPASFWCYHPRRDDVQISALPAATIGHVTFISLNNRAKISSATLDLWAAVLRRIPDARLVIHCPPGDSRQAVLEYLPGDRIEFVGFQQFADYLRTYRRADIALDTFPYNGGITSCDALWMGLPVVSLTGDTPPSRAGRSILSNIGLPEFIARTPEEYVQIAASLAADLPRLAELRRNMRTRMKSSPLMDVPKFINHVETAYRQMWRNWAK